MTIKAEKLEKAYAVLKTLAYRKKFWKMDDFHPYEKQKEFFKWGATCPERLLAAGNQFGKSLSASMEVAYHLTGLYPDGWEGRRWDRPTRGAVAGVSATVVRNVSQKYLCGEHDVKEAFGTGSIPKDLIIGTTRLSGSVMNAFESITVRHASGGVSTLQFLSYEQQREKFQGLTLDFIWNDEEIPEDIYVEECARLTSTSGMIFTTFTPMSGAKDVYDLFTTKGHAKRKLITMTADDTPHMTAERIADMKLMYPKYQWNTRLYGQPMQGEGAVFPIDEEAIKEPMLMAIPEHWFKITGIDFGIGHPFGYCVLLWDKDADCIHVHAAGRMQDDGVGSLPIHHAKAIKAIAAAVPVAWPQDGTAREKGSGKTLASLYKAEGLLMLPDHATHPDGSVDTEAGVMEIFERMASNRCKVASHLSQFFEEFRGYHRKDGKIVKERDDILSAFRIGVMMKRFAKQVQLGGQSPHSSRKNISYVPDGSGDTGGFGA